MFHNSILPHNSISSLLQFDLYIQQSYMNLKKTIAEKYRIEKAGETAQEPCTWRKASMRTTRTWFTMWRTTSTGSGWPPVHQTRRWRCGTSRRTESGFALLGLNHSTSQINWSTQNTALPTCTESNGPNHVKWFSHWSPTTMSLKHTDAQLRNLPTQFIEVDMFDWLWNTWHSKSQRQWSSFYSLRAWLW